MQKSSVAALKNNMRLAPDALLSASLYNTYHFLSQLAGFYAQVVALDPKSRHAKTWENIGDSALHDLGDLYNYWDITARTNGVAADAKLAATVSRQCWRAERLIHLLTRWVPTMKWVSILLMCERRYTKILQRAMALQAAGNDLAERLCTASQGRQQILAAVLKTLTAEQVALHQSYEARLQAAS